MKKTSNDNLDCRKMSPWRVMVISAMSTVIVMLGLFMGIAMAADGDSSTDSDAQTLIHAATGKKDLKWSDVFGDQPGKNMYFMIYKQILVDPDREVEKESAAQNNMKEKELQSILRGDISPIIAKNPGLSVEKAFEKMEQIRSKHNENLAVTTLKKDLESEVQPSEMFANGDTSDSGFDLLADLYRIEKILFDESVPVDVGGNQLGQGTGVPGRSPITKSAADGSDSSGNGDGTTGNSSANSNTSSSGSGAGNGNINPEICLTGDALDKALTKLDKDAESDPRLRNQPAEGIKSSATENGDGTEGGAGTGAAEVKAPPAAEWKNPEFCGDVLCIEIDAKFKTMQPIPRTANCVSCHVKAINKSMKELLSKSLLPSKVTGNLGEPAKCKVAASAAFTSVNMNVVVIGAPVKDPGQNDLVVGKPIGDQWQKFTDRYAPGSGKTTAKKQEEDLKKLPVTTKDQVANKVSADATADADLTKTLEQINRTLTKIEDDRQKALADLATAGNIDNATTYFQALSYQLATMNSYFNSYNKLFTEIEASCKDLSGKKECS